MSDASGRAEVRLGRRDHEAAGAEQLEDLRHPRIGRGEQVAGDLHGQRGRPHHPPLIERGVGFGGAHAGAHQLRVHHQLAQALFRVRQVGVAQRPGHVQRHAQDELALGQVLGRALMRGVHRGAGGQAGAVDQVDVAQEKHALPRHQDVVEEGDAVHLLEARAQRMVEARAFQVEALAAEELQTRGADRDGEVEREGAVRLIHLGQARRVDRDLVGDGRQRGQHARAAHDHAGVGLAHHVQGGAFLQIEDARHGAAALQVDQGVGQRQVVLADVRVVGADVCAELGTALREVVRGTRPGGERDVHEVRRAAHHAAGGPRPVQHHVAPGLQIGPGARDDQGQAHPLAAGRRHGGHRRPQLGIVLHVVERGDGLGAAAEPRVAGHVLDALAPQPDLTRLVPQPLQILTARARRHASRVPRPTPRCPAPTTDRRCVRRAPPRRTARWPSARAGSSS